MHGRLNRAIRMSQENLTARLRLVPSVRTGLLKQSMVSAMMRPSLLTQPPSVCREPLAPLDESIGRARKGGPPCRLQSLFTAAVVLLGIALAVPAAAGTQAVPRPLEFEIAREGDVVGHHRISFRGEGDKLVVHSDLEIEVEMLSFTVYRYQQTREEVWRNGKLVALAATADDDGTSHDIKGTAAPNGELRMTSGKDRWTLPPESVPASFWNQSMVTQKGPLVDLLTGRILPGKVVKLGQETVRAGGRDIVATRYRLEGKRPRDVWYDASGRWVKMRAVGRDGSVAEWMLK